MPAACTVHDEAGVKKGDCLSLIGWDTAVNPARPSVARSIRAALASSKSVYGVASNDAADGAVVNVLVDGDVASEDITNLKPGPSRVVITDYEQVSLDDQCRLKRIDASKRPIHAEFVVGTCDVHGDLTVQPRHASNETEFSHVFNVRS